MTSLIDYGKTPTQDKIGYPADSTRYVKEYTAKDYESAFRRLTLAPHHMRMLQAHYEAPERTLTATQMAARLQYPNYNTANLHYGTLGRLVAERLSWHPLPEQNVFVLSTFKKRGEWHWIMRPAVAKALERLGWVGDGPSIIPEEVKTTAHLYEGAVRTVSVNAYERSSAAREQCILHYGCKCSVCGITLADKYGEAARGLIHVHHLRQLADISSRYKVDPIEDLRPVCPTCHAVIHAQTPPFTIEEIQAMVKMQRKKS